MVHFVDATQWVPDAPGLSGVAYRASTNSLVVVDMQNRDFAGFDNTNLWEYDLDTNTVSYTGSVLPSPATQDPTGVAIDPGPTTSPTDDILFVTSDTTMTVYVTGPVSTACSEPCPNPGIDDIALRPVMSRIRPTTQSTATSMCSPGADLSPTSTPGRHVLWNDRRPGANVIRHPGESTMMTLSMM